MEFTKSGWITVRHPDTGEQHSRHAQEREAIESAANLSMSLGEAVMVRYEQTVRVEAATLPSLEAPWVSWGQTDITFKELS